MGRRDPRSEGAGSEHWGRLGAGATASSPGGERGAGAEARALGREGQGARPAVGPGNVGGAWPGGAGLRGAVRGREGVGTEKEKLGRCGCGGAGGLEGLTRQTMSRSVEVGGFGDLGCVEWGLRDQKAQQGLD